MWRGWAHVSRGAVAESGKVHGWLCVELYLVRVMHAGFNVGLERKEPETRARFGTFGAFSAARLRR